jgi:hypothetical protein
MDTVRPVFKNLLIIAVVLYILALTYTLSDMYIKVGNIEHALAHVSFAGHNK